MIALAGRAFPPGTSPDGQSLGFGTSMVGKGLPLAFGIRQRDRFSISCLPKSAMRIGASARP